ncbi:hypothetical protein CXG81DRAFT_14221 [Caulochytrium protostelioides]|uniref:HTH cro/C1-type domain-containing protein n=1 Tax=Caulochytrium protostelioides TaxID=1555241 RepID=A0A4P9WSU7_9FUNG|nr:hypothetical protein CAUPRSCDRAFT_8367 [Caulochytrium protostelioides]RKO99654.1 hypothetical protein CXG81DRAFT_14221 [Caulochytrium protostelioides]|eukprot:RKO99654.1 hypothetical protein CXG81DRAFT_14221 [Caulochytrium protostelioides]
MSDSWDHQTVIRKTPVNAAASRATTAVNSARRSGAEVVTDRRNVQANAKTQHDSAKASKIDRETENFHVARVPPTVGKTIASARLAKSMTQKELANKIQEKTVIVTEYESGRAVNPDQKILGKMERALGVKLRGKDIGQPLGKPGPKK